VYAHTTRVGRPQSPSRYIPQVADKIVTLPYPLLLQQSTREALGIDLTGHIVIIDEAHNIIDAISALHSTTLSSTQIARGKAQLEGYLAKFSTRLSGRNKMFIKQILALLRQLESFLVANTDRSGQVTATALLQASSGALDQINFYKVEKYLRTSGLPRKVEGATAHNTETPSTPILMVLQSFLVALNNPHREGRIFYSPVDGEMQLRYLLLDPSVVFADILMSARAVVLAGGTMSPLTSYVNTLLPGVAPAKLRVHSFPHIVPKENLCVSTLSRGPSGRDLIFDFSRREEHSAMEELGRAILGLVGICKSGGVVIFVPSYSYLDKLFTLWAATILPKMTTKRKVSPVLS
jgi:chromosome transmission fidelity protein 1